MPPGIALGQADPKPGVRGGTPPTYSFVLPRGAFDAPRNQVAAFVTISLNPPLQPGDAAPTLTVQTRTDSLTTYDMSGGAENPLGQCHNDPYCTIESASGIYVVGVSLASGTTNPTVLTVGGTPLLLSPSDLVRWAYPEVIPIRRGGGLVTTTIRAFVPDGQTPSAVSLRFSIDRKVFIPGHSIPACGVQDRSVHLWCDIPLTNGSGVLTMSTTHATETNFQQRIMASGIPASTDIRTTLVDNPTPIVDGIGGSADPLTPGGSGSVTVTVNGDSDVDVMVRVTGWFAVEGCGDARTHTCTITVRDGATTLSMGARLEMPVGVYHLRTWVPSGIGSFDYQGLPIPITVLATPPTTATVSLSGPATVQEAGNTAVYTLSLSGHPHTEAVDIDITYGGTATRDTDYSGPDSVSIPMGIQTAMVTVNLLDDDFGDDETVEFSVVASGGADVFSYNPSSTVTTSIVDDDGPAITVSLSGPATVHEGGNPAVYTVSLAGAVHAEAVDIDITYGGTATRDTDYSAAVSMVSIPMGVQTTMVTVNIQDDSIDDDDETIEVSIAASGGPASGLMYNPSPPTVTTEIIDLPRIEVGFVAGSFTATESSANAIVTVTTDVDPERSLTVGITHGPGTGANTADPSDYRVTPASVTFDAGVTSADVTVTAVADDLDEEAETMELSLAPPSPALRAGRAAAGAIVTLVDHDGPMYAFALPSGPYEAPRGQIGPFITVSLDPPLQSGDTAPPLTVRTRHANPKIWDMSGETQVSLGSCNSGPYCMVESASGTYVVGVSLATNVTGPTILTVGGHPLLLGPRDVVHWSYPRRLPFPRAGGSRTITIRTFAPHGSLPTSVQLNLGLLPLFIPDHPVDRCRTPRSQASQCDISLTNGSGVFTLSMTDSVSAGGQQIPISGTDLNHTISVRMLTNPETAAQGHGGSADTFTQGGSGSITVTVNSTARTTVALRLTNRFSVAGCGSVDTKWCDVTVNGGAATLSAEALRGIPVGVYYLQTRNSGSQETFSDNRPENDGLPVPVTVLGRNFLATVSLSGPATVQETGNTAVYTISLSGDSRAGNTTVDITYGGTATRGTDYSGTTTSVSIPAGTQTAMVTVSIEDDSDDEADETIVLSVAARGGGIDAFSYSPSPPAVTTTIADNDLVVSLSGPAMVPEAGGTAVYTISLSSGDLSEDVDIDITYGGSATPDTDYDYSGTTSVSIPAGTQTATVSVTTIQDTTPEGDETIEFSIVASGGDSGDVFSYRPSPPTVTTSLVDDDILTATVSLSGPATVQEAGGTAVYTVSLAGDAHVEDVDIGITYGGSATRDTDYSGPDSVSIPVGIQTVMVTVNLQDDDIADDETIELSIAASGGLVSEFSYNPSPAAVTTEIVDDDIPEVVASFVDKTYTATEGGPDAIVTVTLDADPERSLRIGVGPYPGLGENPAREVNDYGVSAYEVTFNPGVTEAFVTVTARDDSDDEPHEALRLQLESRPPHVVYGPETTVTVIDNDGAPTPPAISVLVSGPTVMPEADGVAVYTVSLSGDAHTDTVGIGITYGGTAARDTDYTGPTLVNIPTGTQTATVSVAAIPDTENEGNETIVLTVAASGGGINMFSYTPASPTFTIDLIDDDDPQSVTVHLSGPYSVLETRPNSYTISLSGDLPSGPVDIDITYGGTATRNIDYSAAVSMVSIPVGTQRVTVQVPILNDSVNEGVDSETIEFSITASGTGDDVFVFMPSPPVVTTRIIDDDIPVVRANPVLGSYTAVEGGVNATVAITLDADPERTLSLPVSPSAAGANPAARSDWVVTPRTVTFSAGVTTAHVTVTAVSDTMAEGDETMELFLSGLMPTLNTRFSDSDSPTVTLVDATVVSLSGPAAVSEVGSVAIYTVSLSGVTHTGAVDIDITYGGSATRDTDYTAAVSMVSIPVGTQTATVAVTTTEDSTDEDDETIVFSVAASGSGDRFAYVPSATVTTEIVDGGIPRVEVGFADATYTATEGGANATVTVTVSVDPERALTVALTPDPGAAANAASASDYAVSPGTVTFGAGVTAVDVTVTATDDIVDEEDETMVLLLNSPRPAFRAGLAASEQVVTLVDNDDGPASFDLSVTTVPAPLSESSGTVDVALTLAAPAPPGILVNFGSDLIREDGATADYAGTTPVLGILPTETSVTADIRLTLDDDDIVETDRLLVFAPEAPGITVTPVTLTVTDDDGNAEVAVSWIEPPFHKANEGTDIVLLFGLSRAVDADVSLPWSVGLGGTVAASDFSGATSGTVEFGTAGTSAARTVTVSIGVMEDGLFEGRESVDVSLGALTVSDSGLASRVTLSNTGPVPIVLDDSSPASVVITGPTVNYTMPSRSHVEVTEGGTATLTLSLAGSIGSEDIDVPITIGVPASVHSAQAADHSALPAFIVTIPAGQPTATFEVTTQADSEADAGEVVAISINHPSGGSHDSDAAVGDPGFVGVTIVEPNPAPPAFTTASETYTVAEATPPPGTVGTAVAATDPDGDTVTYRLRNDPAMPDEDSDFFGIDPATGQITIATETVLDFEAAKNTYTVTVEALDGKDVRGVADTEADASMTVSITVTDVTGPPGALSIPSDESTPIAQGGHNRVLLTWLQPTGDTESYDLEYKEVGPGSYTTVTHTGVATVAMFAGLDPDTAYELRVRARGRDGDSDWVMATVTTQMNAPPTFTDAIVTLAVAENTAVGTEVGDPVTVATNDLDTLSYGLTGNNDTLFAVDATGQVSVTGALDFEGLEGTVSLTLTAEDPYGERGTVALEIEVTDVDEPPGVPGAAPEGTSARGTSLLVRWAASTNTGPPVTYEIRYKRANAFNYIEDGDAGYAVTHDGTATTATITGLEPEADYHVQVRALNDEGRSTWGTRMTVRTGLAVNLRILPRVAGPGQEDVPLNGDDALLLFYFTQFNGLLSRASNIGLSRIIVRGLVRDGPIPDAEADEIVTAASALGAPGGIPASHPANLYDADPFQNHDALLLFYSIQFGGLLTRPALADLMEIVVNGVLPRGHDLDRGRMRALIEEGRNLADTP